VARRPILNLRNVFALLGLVGLGIVVLVNRDQFRSFWHLLASLRWYVLAAVVVVQLGSYWVNALYYRSILNIFSYDVGVVRLFEGALATNFVNYIVPSVGLAGAGFLSQVLAPEVPRGESVLTQLMRYALSALSVLVMMPVGFLLIVLSGDAGRTIVKVTLSSAAAITVFAFCLLALVQHESVLRGATNWLISVVKRCYRTFTGEAAVRHFIDEFYVGYHLMMSKKVRMLVPFGWSMIYIIIEVFTFYMAFLAFGRVEDLGIVIMAYLFANIASTFGGVFFSTGTFEMGMAGTLVALGTPLTLAFSVTVVYRVLNLVIGLPPGFYFYRKYLAPVAPTNGPQKASG
jgi:uncharacterized protein (TIRG00374 family)